MRACVRACVRACARMLPSIPPYLKTTRVVCSGRGSLLSSIAAMPTISSSPSKRPKLSMLSSAVPSVSSKPRRKCFAPGF